MEEAVVKRVMPHSNEAEQADEIVKAELIYD